MRKSMKNLPDVLKKIELSALCCAKCAVNAGMNTRLDIFTSIIVAGTSLISLRQMVYIHIGKLTIQNKKRVLLKKETRL